MLCVKCGSTIPDNVKFCPVCGFTQTPAVGDQTALYQTTARNTAHHPPVGGQEFDIDRTVSEPLRSDYMNQNPKQPGYSADATQVYGTPQPGQQARKKLSKGLIALIIAVPVVIAAGLGIYFLTSKNVEEPGGVDIEETPKVSETTAQISPEQTPAGTQGVVAVPAVSYTYQNKSPEASIEFSTVDSVFPSNYRTLEALATFTGYCDYGEMDIFIEVEVPGFTQSYKQKITLGRQVTKLRIVPPLITGDIGLNSEKTAQLVYSVTEVNSGKLLVQESKNIKLYSKYDIIWSDGVNADAFTDNILAWLTPDAPEIVELKRDAIDYLDYITDGALQMIVGYQDIGVFEDISTNTWAQVIAIHGAVSDIAGVRYNNSSFSMDSQQRVLLPADVLRTRSGVCVETSLLLASALQSAGMHCMLIFPPGHAQVALEIWPNTGEYYLIETTILPMEMSYDGWDSVVMYLTQDQWWGYLSGEGEITLGECYVVDCDLAVKLGIRAMSN